MHKRMISIICFMLTILLLTESVAAIPVSVSDDSLSDNTVSDNAVSDNTVSDDSISDNTVSDNAVSNNTVSQNIADTGNDPAAEQTAAFSLQTAATVVKDIGQTVAAVFT